MTNNYKWETPRGARISASITVEHITTETAYADGANIEVACDIWTRTVDTLTVNGAPTALKEITSYRGQDVLLIGKAGKDSIFVAIPANVSAEIFGTERKANAEKAKKHAAADAAYDAHCEMMRKAMSR